MIFLNIDAGNWIRVADDNAIGGESFRHLWKKSDAHSPHDSLHLSST